MRHLILAEIRRFNTKGVIRLEHNLHDIKEIRETRDPEEANRLLREGWMINYISHEPSHSRYVLILVS